MLNDYVWRLYIEANGKNVVQTFRDNIERTFSASYANFIANLQKVYCPSELLVESTEAELVDLFNDLDSGMKFPVPERCTTQEEVMGCFSEWLHHGGQCSDKDIFECFSGSVAYFTTFLALTFPYLFIPYYFLFNFNVLEKIMTVFDIEHPQMPLKKDYRGRFDYYGEICAALLAFADKHSLSVYELCAFLYDFAPQYIGGVDSYIIKDLPEPKRAFFVGGSKKDSFYSELRDAVTPWQCSPDTMAGDMIVMYLKSPESAVNSVWRSVSVGFNDPFFFYYRCTYIGRPIVIKSVPQKLLQHDAILKNLPIVRKNMQGINGVELNPSEYNRLIDISGSTDVPRLQFAAEEDDADCINERDVEDKLIKPLIEQLGYSEHDYVQQLYIEIGNHNHTLIPDFVLLPVAERGRQSAFALIEAKYGIPNLKAMEEAKIQARSYARQLNVEYSIIASKDKIWVSACDDDFTEDIFVSTWAELNVADIFLHLFKIIGKESRMFYPNNRRVPRHLAFGLYNKKRERTAMS